MQRIGSPSAFGVVISIDFGGIEKLFLIKGSNKEDLTHELVTGLSVLNQTREEIPNFSYIYGGFNC